ncbi:AraC family transcriptional regulator [Cohnella sp.]|uniref:AraC family transcriptional regulator n=1 Tax=Cohnella sp. TaxID=1883426 RepID=UPI00356A05C5
MNRLFSPVQFDGKPILWDHRQTTVMPFEGYYHWHPCCEILWVHEGEGTVIVNQNTHEIRRGMLFVFQPFQLHKVYPRASEERPYIRSKLYFQTGEISEKLAPFPQRNGLLIQLTESQGISQAYDFSQQIELLDELGDWHNRSSVGKKNEEEAFLLLMQLLGTIEREQYNSDKQIVKTAEQRSLRYSEKIMRWIEDHYSEEASLDQIAEELHLSKFYVSRVFRQETGSSITDYLTARRIKQACRLLQTTTLSVERIGIEVGLPDASYFVQLFKKVVGTTPLKYRNQ